MAFLVFVVALVSVLASVLVFVATFIVTVTILVLVPVVFAELVYVALVVLVSVDAFAHTAMTGVMDDMVEAEVEDVDGDRRNRRGGSGVERGQSRSIQQDIMSSV
jgi:hypothetical protein